MVILTVRLFSTPEGDDVSIEALQIDKGNLALLKSFIFAMLVDVRNQITILLQKASRKKAYRRELQYLNIFLVIGKNR